MRMSLNDLKDILPPHQLEKIKAQLKEPPQALLKAAKPPKKNPAEQKLKEQVELLASQYGLECRPEHAPIAGRRFRLDVAIPELRIGFECDGWQYHAKHKEAWLKEKRRDRIFLMHGWRVFRFAASEVLSGIAQNEIEEVLKLESCRKSDKI